MGGQKKNRCLWLKIALETGTHTHNRRQFQSSYKNKSSVRNKYPSLMERGVCKDNNKFSRRKIIRERGWQSLHPTAEERRAVCKNKIRTVRYRKRVRTFYFEAN